MKSNEPISSFDCSSVNFGNRFPSKECMVFGYFPLVSGCINLQQWTQFTNIKLTQPQRDTLTTLLKPYHPNMKSRALLAAPSSNVSFENGINQWQFKLMPIKPFWNACSHIQVNILHILNEQQNQRVTCLGFC